MYIKRRMRYEKEKNKNENNKKINKIFFFF